MYQVSNKGAQEVKAQIPQNAGTSPKVKMGGDLRTGIDKGGKSKPKKGK